MEKEKYLSDIKEIKDIMEKSSRFISLSGLSGIFAGVFALAASYLAYLLVYRSQDYMAYRKAYITVDTITLLLALAVGTILLTITTGIIFNTRKARKLNQKIWDGQTKRLLVNLAIPLIAGGALSFILLLKGFIGLVAPLTLIFYGLALINASKYTLSDIRSLGIVEIILGLIATHYIGYGLIFWAIGFGVMHIVYGIFMHFKYEQ